MKNKPFVVLLIICILIAAAGLAYEYLASGGMFAATDQINSPQSSKEVYADEELSDTSGKAEDGAPINNSSDNDVVYREIATKNAMKNREKIQKLFQNKQLITIDCLGDSITWGMYSTPELEEAIDNGEIYTGYDDGGQLFEDFNIYVSSAYQSEPSYPEVLEQELNRRLAENGKTNIVTTVNDGICGDWIMPQTWQRMTCDPDIVVFLMSGNNFYMNVPLNGTFEANIEALTGRGKIVYLANYPLYPGGPLMQYFQAANELIAEMAEKYDLPLIDLYSMVKDRVVEANADGTYTWNELYSPDKTHLSVKGYELIGMLITDALYNDIRTN